MSRAAIFRFMAVSYLACLGVGFYISVVSESRPHRGPRTQSFLAAVDPRASDPPETVQGSIQVLLNWTSGLGKK